MIQHQRALQHSISSSKHATPHFIHIRSPSFARRYQARNARPAVTTTAVETSSSTAGTSQPVDQETWDSFASNVYGEWEGITATFSPSGMPQQLPEHYVPEAFREWGVELWDWQSQCSCLATPDSRGLRSTLRRLMPTVGCEADAIAFTEEDASSSSSSSSDSSSDSNGQGLFFTLDGSYNSGPAVLPPIGKAPGPSKFQIEHCIALPTDTSSSSSSSRMRLKVVQQFRRNWATGAWILDSVDLHREKFDGPYTGKRELAGCGGGQPVIAQLPVLQANCLAGKWTTQDSRLSCIDAAGAVPDGTQLTLLPLQVWSAVHLTPRGQLQRAEAGVLLQQQQQQDSSSSKRLVSCRVYDASTGQLQGAQMGQEARA